MEIPVTTVTNYTGGSLPSSATGSGTSITITMSASVTGNGTLENAFKAFKNGTEITVNATSASGADVTLTLGTSVTSSDTVTAEYMPTSTDYLTDSSSNKSPPFTIYIVTQ